jgi:hypothetical protein
MARYISAWITRWGLVIRCLPRFSVPGDLNRLVAIAAHLIIRFSWD